MAETTFAKRLVDAREAAGLSKYELARRSGLSRQALSLLELGEREPNWTTVQLLAAALGTDCRQFTDPDLTLPVPEEPRPKGRPPKPDAAPAPPAAAKKPAGPAKKKGKK